MTLRRIRVYSTLIAVVMWTMWAVDMTGGGVVDRLGKLKGTDFLQFYVGGAFAREGRLQDFYDPQKLHARATALVPASRDTIYLPIQSPQTALVFAPLSALSYGTAVAIWLALVVALYLASCWLIWIDCDALRHYRSETLIATLAFPGLYATVLYGQTSVVALLAVTAALAALRRNHPVVAGLALGCLVFKPHWLLVVTAVAIAAGEWRMVAGAIASAAVQVAITCAAAGGAAMRGYWAILVSTAQIGDLLEPRPGDSLRSFFRVFVPSQTLALALYVAASCGALALAARIWRGPARFEERAPALVLTAILISPHAFAYDLILLAPVYLMMANAFARVSVEPPPRAVVWTLCALFVAPILAAVPAPLRLQCSVTAMAVLLVRADPSLGAVRRWLAGAYTSLRRAET